MPKYAYILARDVHAQAEQERRTAGMAVNSGSLMLKRCRQAQKVHGNDPSHDAPALPVRMGKKVRATVQDGFSGRPGSSGVGSSNDGGYPTPGPGQDGALAANGPLQK